MATNYIYTNSLRLQGRVLYKGDFLVSRGVVRIVFHHKGDLGLLLNCSKIVDRSLSSSRLQERKVIVLCVPNFVVIVVICQATQCIYI
jgi:hypothetical protein